MAGGMQIKRAVVLREDWAIFWVVEHGRCRSWQRGRAWGSIRSRCRGREAPLRYVQYLLNFVYFVDLDLQSSILFSII